MYYDKDFIIAFEKFNGTKEYIFTYKQTTSTPIITFRILEEIVRTDVENLISKVGRDREEEGLSKLNYEPTFYKVINSSFISWYGSMHPTLLDTYPHPTPSVCNI